MSMVPLNLGAAAPFRLNPHLEQVVAVSGFCVPQFGQNTRHLRSLGAHALGDLSLHGLGRYSQVRCGPRTQGSRAVLRLQVRRPRSRVSPLRALDTPLCASLRFARPTWGAGFFFVRQAARGCSARFGRTPTGNTDTSTWHSS